MSANFKRQSSTFSNASGPQSSSIARDQVQRPIRLLAADDLKLDPKLQAYIGEQLRGYYAELLSEPVPDRFAELVKRLDRKH